MQTEEKSKSRRAKGKEDKQETIEPGGSELRDRTGKPCEAEPRAIERPPETDCLPCLWQVKPDTGHGASLFLPFAKVSSR